MALKTTSTPLDPLTLTEWRDTIASWLGVAYASLSSSAQAELNRIVNEAHEKISQRAAHYPWGQRRTTIAVTGDNVGQDDDDNYQYLMPADFRRLLVISESSSGTRYRAKQAEYLDYLNAADGVATHPWAADASNATWFFQGMSDAQPPRQTWVRVGGPATATAVVVYVPYLALLSTGADSYTVLPAAEVAAIREEARYKWALFSKDYEAAAVHRQAREDEIASLEIGDRQTHDDPIPLGLADSFRRELS